MSTPRRRIIRQPAARPAADPHRLAKLRTRLEVERSTLARWMPRLRRAFHTVERGTQAIARIERQITALEGP